MAESSPRQGILSLSIKEKSALYAAYMPFVTNGGLFIPTTRDYDLGQDVFILLNLMDDTERIPVAGKIIWKTPAGAEGYRCLLPISHRTQYYPPSCSMKPVHINCKAVYPCHII